jgi:hypothetical protein
VLSINITYLKRTVGRYLVRNEEFIDVPPAVHFELARWLLKAICMSKTLSRAVLTILLASAPAFATEYADFDLINQSVNTVNDRLYGTFNLLTAGAENDSQTMTGYGGDLGGNGTFSDLGGFQLGSTVENAAIEFWFSDPAGGGADGYVIRINVASLQMYGYAEWDVSNDTDKEYQSVAIEGTSFGAEVLLAISNTGIVEWKIQSLDSGSFNVDAGRLIVNATAPVPDGGSTAILLGMGMIGMVGLQRKLRK